MNALHSTVFGVLAGGVPVNRPSRQLASLPVRMQNAVAFVQNLQVLRPFHARHAGNAMWKTSIGHTAIDGWSRAYAAAGDVRANERVAQIEFHARTRAIGNGRIDEQRVVDDAVFCVLQRTFGATMHPTVFADLLRDAQLYARVFFVCDGLDMLAEDRNHAQQRMDVWRMGFGLAAATEGAFYAYGLRDDAPKLPGCNETPGTIVAGRRVCCF